MKIILSVIIGLLLLAPVASAHDLSCRRNYVCRKDKTTAEVRYHGFVTYGRGVSWTNVHTQRWGRHSWRGTFSYGQYNTNIVCRGSVIMNAHTGHAIRWRESCS